MCQWSGWCAVLLSSSLLLQVQVQGQLQLLGQPPFRAYASRSTLPGQVLYRLFAVNSVTGSTSTAVTYSILQSSTAASSSRHFSLRTDTGELLLISPFSSLVEHTLVVEARAADSQTPVQASLLVTVVPESDLRPRYEQDSYNISVSEGLGVGRTFSVIRAFPFTEVTSQRYDIISDTSGGRFSLDPTHGLLTVSRSLDRELADRHSLTIRYSFNEDQFLDTEVLLSVLDLNDNSPLFLEGPVLRTTMPENSPVSTSILTIRAVDPDLGVNADVSYSLTTPSPDFSLDAHSGLLTIASEPDYERMGQYQLTVIATDSGSPPLSSTAVLIVDVANVEDECPRFENPLYLVDLPSSAVGAGSELLTLLATDPDGIGGIAYAIVSGEGSSSGLSLDGSTGVLTVANAADLRDEYLLNVSASDGGCPMGNFASVRIRITDANDHDPMFVTPCDAVLVENSAPGTQVTTLTAEDVDSGLSGRVSYSLLNDSYFSVDSGSGMVTTNQIASSYDRETLDVLQVGVVAMDGGGRQGYCLLTITLADENDNSPIFTSEVYGVSLSPDTPPLSTMVGVAAFDADAGSNGNVSYSLSGPEQSLFSIDQATGEIRTMSLLNETSSQSLSLTVTATDMGQPVGLSSTTLVTISLAPGAPVFSRPRYTATICENAQVSSSVLSVSASFTPTYRLLSGSDYSSNGEGTFIIAGNSIFVGSQSLVDYERLNSRKSFLFSIQAENPLGRSSALVEVFVTDLDDNPPVVFTGYSFSLPENQPVGTVLTQILARDADRGTNGEIAYRLATPSLFFSISESGEIRSTHVFDFEDPTEMHSGLLTVQLYNPNSQPSGDVLRALCGRDVPLISQSAMLTVSWAVLDQNDNAPGFDQMMYALSVPENQTVWTSIFAFSATDRDASDQSELSFVITGGNDGGTFAVAGDALVLARGLDYETRTTFDLMVRVTDGVHGSASTCSQCTASITITVSDVDDELPVFASSAFQVELVETVPPGTTILSVAAQDEDTPTISYGLSGRAQGRLRVTGSGDVLVSGSLDRESLTNGTLSFFVFAGGGGVAAAEVVLNLLDVNDNGPRFTEIFSGRVQENTPPGDEGVSVAQVVAQDLDSGRNGTVTYSLVGDENGSGMEDAEFRIDPESGVITAHREFDREEQSSYLLTVQATDDGIPFSRTSTSVVRVEVADLNDNPPSLPFPHMFARVFENAPIGSHVLTLPVVDPDNVPTVTFTLLSATPPGLYALDPATGEVTVASSLDYEDPIQREAELQIMIRDPSFPVETADMGNLSISLLDRNDHAPVLRPPEYSPLVGLNRLIPETLPPGQLLATVSASDDDGGVANSELLYSIASGDEMGVFNISNQGQVRNTRSPDYETASQYTLIVSVSDSGDPPLSSQTTLEFNIIDFNDNPPSFDQPVYRVSVPENGPPVASLLRVAATDPDTSAGGGEVVAYAIVDGNEGVWFSLNDSTGVLGTTTMFDREERASYLLTLTATDGGADPQTGTGTVVVSIQDVNDNPSSLNGLQLVYVRAGGGVTTPGPIGQVHFADPDMTNDFVDCMDQSGAFFELFEVSSVDCELTILRSDLDEGTFTLSIRGNDGVHTSVTTSVVIVVEHLANETLSEEGVVTITLNATAEEYYQRRLNLTLPSLLAQHLGAESGDVHIVSLQPGYHDPSRTLDMTLSVSGPSGDLLPPIQVLNRLFQNREGLFVDGYGVTALPTDPCVSEPCANQARCIPTQSIGPTHPALDAGPYLLLAPRVTLGYRCECVPGTSGQRCEINYDDCYSDPCMHGAECTDSVQGFLCDCPQGTSARDCSFNPDECASDPCLNHARCVNGFGAYVCECLPAYYGPECQYTRFQVSPTCDLAPCWNGATCSPGRDGFTCVCPEGFDGTLCETAVQLQGGCVGNPCHHGSLCEDTPTGFACQCSVGFTGPTCRWPLDACELEPCRNGATCETGLYGSFLCTCAPGFTGETCDERVPGCQLEREEGTCLNGGRCVNDRGDDGANTGNFSCRCPREFTGERCEVAILPPDVCQTDAPCPPSTNCSSGTDGTFTCSCPEGSYGPRCSLQSPLASPCSSNPCLHGGQCLADSATDYTCLCSHGFTGVNCEVNIDDCARDPCLNEGACRDGLGGFVCECDPGVTGEVCQVFCPEGRRGEFCETVVPQCTLTSCENGGTCSESYDTGSFECTCPSTHTGQTCQTTNNCSASLCLNGGTCSDNLPGEGRGGGAECSCQPGFNGPHCELSEVSFSGDGASVGSFRAYGPLPQWPRTVGLEFATRAEAGLLLFSTQWQGGASREWVVLEVVGQRLRASLALGSGEGGVVVMGGSVRVSDGLWHRVSLEISGRTYQVLLDECQLLEEGLLPLSECREALTTPGNSSFLNLGLPLWIGGVPFATPPSSSQFSSVGFSGCIRNVTLDGELLDLEGHIEERNSRRGCGQLESSCAGSPCGEGRCVPSLGAHSCICPPLMAGDSCESAASSLMFSGGSYAQYTLHQPDPTPTGPEAAARRKRRQTTPTMSAATRSTLSDRFSLRFRTAEDQGILFHVGGLDSADDFSYVQLREGGRLSYHVNLGAGEEGLDFPAHLPAVDDALWHFLALERVALELTVTLDNLTFSHTLGGNQLYLDVGYGDFYAGGPPREGAGVYMGCLRDIRVDDSVLPTSGSNGFASIALRGNGSSSVGARCALRGCFPDPCGGGACEEVGQEGFACMCEDGSRRVSEPCPVLQPVTPYLLIIIVASVIGGLVLLLVLAVIVMVCWRRYTTHKQSMRNLASHNSAQMVLGTRDCVVISNDAGGGEQDTTMTEEKWQQSIPLSRKCSDSGGHTSSSSDDDNDTATSSDRSIQKPRPPADDREGEEEEAATQQTSSEQEPKPRAQSPVISAFIDRRLEALGKEYPDHDTMRVYSEEGDTTSKISLNSFCSYQSREEPYTVERLEKAGPRFRQFAGLLEVLVAEEEAGTVDTESEVVHTGLTQQTQTQSQTQSQGVGLGSQGNGGYYF